MIVYSFRTVEVAEEFRKVTLHVIAEAVCSINHEESDHTFAEMYLPIVMEGHKRTWNPLREYFPNQAWFQHRAHINRLNAYITQLVSDRWEQRQREKEVEKEVEDNDDQEGEDEEGEEGGSSSRGSKKKAVTRTVDGSVRRFDVLDMILEDIDEADWGEETLLSIRDGLKTFILAGHETSASNLTWALLEVISNPDILARVKEEAETVWGDDAWDGSIENLPPKSFIDNNLMYTENCLREALRKWSVVPTVVRFVYFIPFHSFFHSLSFFHSQSCSPNG